MPTRRDFLFLCCVWMDSGLFVFCVVFICSLQMINKDDITFVLFIPLPAEFFRAAPVSLVSSEFLICLQMFCAVSLFNVAHTLCKDSELQLWAYWGILINLLLWCTV